MLYKRHLVALPWSRPWLYAAATCKRSFSIGAPSSEVTAVVIGSDCTGASLAYHLANGGLRDVVLVEPPLPHPPPATCGLASNYHQDVRFRRIHRESVKLYTELSADTPGLFTPTDTIRLCESQSRVSELKYHSSQMWEKNYKYELLDKAAFDSLLPFIDTTKIAGALQICNDGYLDELSLKATLIAKAQEKGVTVYQNTEVKSVKEKDKTWFVETPEGIIHARHFINGAGILSKDIGRLSGIDLPLAHVAHPYLVTKAVANSVPSQFPVVHHLDRSYYFRRHGDGILVGVIQTGKDAEPVLMEWWKSGVPKDFSYEPSAEDKEVLNETLKHISGLSPSMGTLEAKHYIFEPLSLSPDGYPIVGPINGAPNYWVAAGFGGPCSLAAGGIGKYLADHLIDDEPPFELTCVEANRYYPWVHRCRNFILEKVRETYQMQYANSAPQFESERPAGRPTTRVSGIYGALLQQGGRMNLRAGWEQCTFFSTSGKETYQDMITRECGYVMNTAGLIDLSLYGKLEVKGPDATALMDYAFASKVPEMGTMGVGFSLTPKGKLYSRVRIIHHMDGAKEPVFILMVRPEQENRELSWIQRLAEEKDFNIQITNVTDYLGCIGIVGPETRNILNELTISQLTDENYPHMSSRLLRLRNIPCIACRDTTTGELGWHLYHGRADSLKVYELLMQEGRKYGVGNFGRYAFNSLRIEKGEKFWGHELTLDYNPVEAGIMDKLDLDKDFVGAANIREIVKQPPKMRLVQLLLEETGSSGKVLQGQDPDGLEAVTLDGEIVGHTTSGCFGFNVKKFLCFAYINSLITETDPIHVKLYGLDLPAKILDKPPLLPHHLREAEQQQEMKATG